MRTGRCCLLALAGASAGLVATGVLSATAFDGLSTAGVVSAGVVSGLMSDAVPVEAASADPVDTGVASVDAAAADLVSPAFGASTAALAARATVPAAIPVEGASTTEVAAAATDWTLATDAGGVGGVGYGFGLPPVVITPPM